MKSAGGIKGEEAIPFRRGAYRQEDAVLQLELPGLSVIPRNRKTGRRPAGDTEGAIRKKKRESGGVTTIFGHRRFRQFSPRRAMITGDTQDALQIQRVDAAVVGNGDGMPDPWRLIVSNRWGGAISGLPAHATIMARPDHIAGTPVHVLRFGRVDRKLTVVRDDLLARHDSALDICRHFSPSQAGVLRAKETAQIRHRPDFFCIRGMRHHVLDPSAPAGPKRVPCFRRECGSRER